MPPARKIVLTFARRIRKLCRISLDPTFRSGLRDGVAATVEHEGIPFGSDFRSVLDVGANRGQFALFALSRFPRARLYCFEPLQQPRRKLAAVLARHPDATLFAVALGSSVGESHMHVTTEADSSSMLSPSRRQIEEFPGSKETNRERVRTARLDDLVEAGQLTTPSLLKIDVQGFELEVLRGACSLLPEIDEILVECSFVELYEGQPLADEVICFLRGAGFGLRGVTSLVHGVAGSCLQADLHFSRIS